MKFSWIRRLFRRPVTSTIRKAAPRRARPCLELLEDRTMLAVVPTVSGSDVTFSSSDSSDKVYVQTVVNGASSKVQWSSDGGSWEDLSGLTLAGPGATNTFTFDMSGEVHLRSFTGAGGHLTLN